MQSTSYSAAYATEWLPAGHSLPTMSVEEFGELEFAKMQEQQRCANSNAIITAACTDAM